MKLFLMMLMLVSIASAKTIKEGDTEYQCTPMENCEDQLKKLKAENARLKKQLKEKKEVQVVQIVEKPVEKVVYETEIKKHIISLVSANESNDAKVSTNANTATATSETRYIPSLTYQYQFDNGITPLVGLGFGNQLKGVFGLGYEF